MLFRSDFVSPDLAGSIISTDLREQVAAGKGAQYWQSVTLGTAAGAVPGVVVGSAVVIPGVGDYELYIAYSFAQSEQTLSFVYQVLWFAGLILLILVGIFGVLVITATPVRYIPTRLRQLLLPNHSLPSPSCAASLRRAISCAR